MSDAWNRHLERLGLLDLENLAQSVYYRVRAANHWQFDLEYTGGLLKYQQPDFRLKTFIDKQEARTYLLSVKRELQALVPGSPMKCRIGKNHEAEWSWQPWGPGKENDTFTLPGSHYRGFPVIKVCDSCKEQIQEAQASHSEISRTRGVRQRERIVKQGRGAFWLAVS